MARICYLFCFLGLLHIRFAAQNWVKTSGPGGGTVTVATANQSIVVIALKDKGLYFSTDLGNSWQPTVVRKSIRGLNMENNLIVATTDDSLYYSTNKCQTFTKRPIASGLGNLYLKN